MHNSYMTLPVLFTMISNHFASLYGHALSWVALILVIVVGAFIRHTMITAKKWPLIPALGGLAVLMAMTAPRSSAVLAASGQGPLFRSLRHSPNALLRLPLGESDR